MKVLFLTVVLLLMLPFAAQAQYYVPPVYGGYSVTTAPIAPPMPIYPPCYRVHGLHYGNYGLYHRPYVNPYYRAYQPNRYWRY